MARLPFPRLTDQFLSGLNKGQRTWLEVIRRGLDRTGISDVRFLEWLRDRRHRELSLKGEVSIAAYERLTVIYIGPIHGMLKYIQDTSRDENARQLASEILTPRRVL